MGSSARENKPGLDKYAGYVPEELSLPEKSTTYFFEESVRRVPDAGALRRFDETISYAELDALPTATIPLADFWAVYRPMRSAGRRSDEVHRAAVANEGALGERDRAGEGRVEGSRRRWRRW